MTMSLKENSSNLEVVLPANTDVHSIWSGTMFETTDDNYRALECQHPDDSVFMSQRTAAVTPRPRQQPPLVFVHGKHQ